MREVKSPAAAWTTATGNNPKKTRPKDKAEEVNLQILASTLQSGESVQIAPGIWFSKLIELQFDPDPVPEGWLEEFGQAHVHPRTAEILFHRALFEAPTRPWQTLGDKEALIALSDAWKAFPHLHAGLTLLAFKAWRFSAIRPLPLRMNEELRALWTIYCANRKKGNRPT
jgi:hypothetical protein